MKINITSIALSAVRLASSPIRITRFVVDTVKALYTLARKPNYEQSPVLWVKREHLVRDTQHCRFVQLNYGSKRLTIYHKTLLQTIVNAINGRALVGVYATDLYDSFHDCDVVMKRTVIG